MTFILIIIVGGILGWLASIVMRTDASQGIFLNIVVGIVGALLAGFLITPLIGGAPITSGSFDIMSLVASFIGALVLLAIVNLFRRGSVR
ncbi:GlsB/YeaQ/YmgE family stress response membrane protein [Erythrobacter sp.]|uniref:GlsB/YeaQ/YmgE family stress response membrane protein n=1 Tax=Erythrobacter sp. TaxID=1042 RepID=UPI0025FEF4C5|nr:GlsB/YeaQ/YmgE family stress response membrane protein [Erythrobacter sp.]